MANQQPQVVPSTNLNKKGLSLLEIIVSTIIVALLITGLVSVFVSGRKLIVHSRNRMAAGELGKKFLDPLQALVRQDSWNSNALGTGTNSSGTDGSYNYSYGITNLTATVRKVKATITWNVNDL